MYVAVMILGLVLLAVGGQGAIRILVDDTDVGLLSWLPGGFAVQLAAYLALTIAGLLLAGWGADRARKAGTLE